MSEADARGLQAARRYARWHIGDSNWADSIIGAYLNPDAAMEALDHDQEAR